MSQADTEPTDRILLQRMAAGDRAALSTMYRAYHGRLTRFLNRLTRRADIIEEVINDCFWIAWQKASNFHGDSRVSTWIMGIAYRRALNMLRRATTHDRAMRLEIAEGEPTASDSAQELEERQLLNAGLAQLPLEQRLVLEFTYYLDHSCEEIAEIMDCPVNTVKTRMFNARRKLRVLLKDSAPSMENRL